MKKLFRNIILTILLATISTFIIQAQNRTEINDSIYSKILKETRSIKIRLPKEYNPESAQKYEVIYILDGEWNMSNFSFIYNFAMEDKFVPPVILVALPNTYINGENMRDRDFLPFKMKNNKLAGGANNFIEFLKQEIIPYIDKKYPTNGKNSLYGHSYGGLFSMYVLLNTPDLFEKYYCTDPPLKRKNGFITNLAKDIFSKKPKLQKKLWIAGTTNNSSIKTMHNILENSAPKNLVWETATYPNEKHNSVRLKGIYDGIKFCYK